MTDNHESLIRPTDSQISYATYLKIPELLDLQRPLSAPEEQDEMLFILIHQVYELWFKQILHEVRYAASEIDTDQIMPFFRTIRRITTIQETLTSQVSILETMTPNDFNRFRDRLNPASGFQSYQFRVLEFMLGAKCDSYLKFYRNDTSALAALESALAQPTLFDLLLQYLHRQGIAIPEHVLTRDFRQTYKGDPDVTHCLLTAYQQPDTHYELYLTLESLADLDEKFLLWRFRHIAMVERMIGNRRGTGGSSGVNYLTTTLAKRFFPDIWEIRNHLVDH